MRLLRLSREMLLRVVTHGRGVRRVVNGLPVRVDPRARHSFAPAYDAPVAAYLRDHVRQGAEVWNVGANVGVYVLQLAAWVGASGKIVAFEPNPIARRVLRANVRLNGLGGQVEIVDSAVGGVVGTVDFFTAGTDGMARGGAPNPLLTKTRRLKVNVTTLDVWAEQRGRIPSWIVMDIEGWEIAALQGGRKVLAACQFAVELHPSAWGWSGHSRADLEALIDEFNLEVLPLAGQSDALAEHGQVLLRRRCTQPLGTL